MNSDQLLAQYEKVADAPDAIPRLRRFILDLAVRGKLVLQEPTDEPASELQKRIATAKKELGVKHLVSALSLNDVPFALPVGWAWTRIGEICSKTGSGSTPRGGKDVYKKAGVPFLRSQNVYNDGLRLDDVAFIERHVHERMKSTRVLPGDLLLNITGGSIGRCGLVPLDFEEANVSQHVAIVRPALKEMKRFLHILILSPYFQAFILDEQTGAGRGGLPKNRMDKIAVALPPLAEQHRIVARVDELMALCDRLEAAREKREATRDRLTAASLACLKQPDPDPQSFRAHAAQTLEALAPLTTRPDQISHLRQTILNLAVRGKLVEQDAEDEPASKLLKQIAIDRQQMLKDGVIKKQKAILPIRPDQGPYDLPGNWKWARFNEIAAIQSHLVDPKRYPELPHIAPDNIEGWTAKLLPYLSVKEAGVFSGKHLFSRGSILYSKIRPNLAKVTVADFEGLCSADMYPIRPYIYREFLVKYMITPVFVDQSVSEENRVAMPKINQAALSNILVPVPPLAEQHRIVAKVDALMALCDRLETAINASGITRSRLLEGLLHEALSPATVREMEAAE